MQDNTNEHNDEISPVRKFLRQLPPIRASEDFERRLQRRIAEKRERGIGKVPFYRRPLPAIAYSAATILVVSLITYYAFLREGIPPASPVEEQPVPAEPSQGPLPEMKEKEREKTVPVSPGDQRRSREREDLRQQQSPEIKSLPDEHREAMQPVDEAGKGAAATTVPAPSQKTIPQIQQDVMQQSSESGAPTFPAQVPKSIPGLKKEITPATVPAEMYKAAAPIMTQTDSTALKDSLNIDSTRGVRPVRKKR